MKSIDNQIGIDFNDIEVIIDIDGDGLEIFQLKEKDLSVKNFKPILLSKRKHKGISFTRNNLMRNSHSNYIMWIDCDDELFNMLALNTLLKIIDDRHFDLMNSTFVMETILDKAYYTKVKNDLTHAHGKVYNKQFLLDNNLLWPEDVNFNEDFTFNILVGEVVKKPVYCNEAFYLWHQNNKSITRNDSNCWINKFSDIINSESVAIQALTKK